MGARREALNDLLDKQAIREALEAFSRGMDRFDQDLFLSALWDDSEIAAGPFVGSAVDCWDWAKALHEEGQELTQHALLQSNIELDGDTAHAETYYQFAARNRDGTLMLAGGRYIDRLERRHGEWRIALRTNQVEWSCLPPVLSLPFADLPDVALNGVSSRSPEDPSYQRPLINRRAAQRPEP
jgi:ketosteroid isomerase-like protein